MKLTSKVLLFNLLFGLFFGLAIGLLSYFSMVDNAKRELGIGQQVRAEETMKKIDHFLYERYIEIQELANSFRFIIEDEDALSVEIREIQLLSGTWDKIKVIDELGIILASTDENEKGTKLASEREQELYELAWSGEVVYSDIEHSGSTSQVRMVWSVPIRARVENNREVVGVIMFDLSRYILEELLESSWGTEEGMYIMNSDGKVLSFQHEEVEGEALHHHDIDQNIWEKIKNAEEPLEIGNLFFRKETLVASVEEAGHLDYSGNGWYLVSQLPVESVKNRTIREMVTIFTSLGVASFLIIIGLMFFMNRVVIKPIIELTRVASKMTKGEIGSRVKVNTNDELGQLGKSFNLLMDKLIDAQRKLEDKVEERTKRLTKTMDLMVGRELKMRQMKEQMREMSNDMEEKNED